MRDKAGLERVVVQIDQHDMCVGIESCLESHIGIGTTADWLRIVAGNGRSGVLDNKLRIDPNTLDTQKRWWHVAFSSMKLRWW